MSSAVRGFLIALLLASTSAIAQVRTATIFVYRWDVETRWALQPSDVRNSPSVKTEILDGEFANSLRKWLTSERFITPMDHNPLLNIRLVIDFKMEDGSVESYYANRFKLFEVKSGKARVIDEKFKSRFSSFLR